jgi:hypothetical protein
MPRLYHFKPKNMRGGCNRTCNLAVNVDNYKAPCLSLPLDQNFNQSGGAKLYQKIVNPKTGRKVSVNGKIGKDILRQYIHQLRN